MTEPRPVYTVVDPENLMPDELAQLRFVLSILSPHQLVQIAARIKQICVRQGFGEMTITMKNGHPDELKAGESPKLLPHLDPEVIERLMDPRNFE